MEKENGKKHKGTFGGRLLSVAKEYVFPDARRVAIVLGTLAGLSGLVFFAVDFLMLKKSLTASGPVSSFHAKFEKDCSSCHEPFGAVTNAKCSVCHEKTGDELGIYTFAGHQVYRSGEASRLQEPTETDQKETACVLCHQEHQGRLALITNVPDTRCVNCHQYGSFNANHPQFDFAAAKAPDDSTLKFTHVKHVQDVMKREKLVDVERACLYCHNPEPEGRHFEPITFATHCQACHLTGNVETPAMKLKNPLDFMTPGVETLETLRLRGGLTAARLRFVSASDFTIKPGDRIVKTPVRHEDAWIMENLRQLRQTLGGENDLDDLLKTSGKINSQNQAASSAEAYQEALAILEDYAEALRSRPEREVQLELIKIDSLLQATRNRLRQQPLVSKEMAFVAPPASRNSTLPPAQVEDIMALADNLTKACQECHTVANAGILRVQKDQQILARAEFDHRAHILQRRCLECHTGIPILPPESAKAANGAAKAVLALADRSAIQNIPAIENCQQCHNADETSNRCVTCHYFHPNKTQRSSMLLYLD
ncbi:MAG: cytochrome c3 family protein [bacterium]